MVYCTAFNCNNDGKSSASFFQFPSNEKYRKIWRDKVRRVDWEPTDHSRLCSAHFESHCFAQKLKLLESLGLPPPKKLILKHDAIPTIFDYEDRSSAATLARKRKSVLKPQSDRPKAKRQRKVIEVIDFGSLLDEYLKGLQSEDTQLSAPVKKGSNELVDEIVPGSALCQGGDKFVLLLNKPIPEAAQSLPLVVRFGSGHVVPATLWKDCVIRGESIPKSDFPGPVPVQLETNEGAVLGSTTFRYRDEITTGFQRVVLSKNYGEKLLDAFCWSRTSTTTDDSADAPPIKTEFADDAPSSDSCDSHRESVLRLMFYIAARNQAAGFIQYAFKTKVGKEVLSAFQAKPQHTEHMYAKATIQCNLTSYIEDTFKRLVVEEKKAMDELQLKQMKLVKPLKKKEPEKAVKSDSKKKAKPAKDVKRTKINGKVLPLAKKPVNQNGVSSAYSDMTSKTNSLLLLSDIALRHLNSDAVEANGVQDLSSATVKQRNKSTQLSRNTRSFSRKILLLASSSTCLPPQLELSKLRKVSESCGTLQLDIDMTAPEVLKQVRVVFSGLGKKRVRLAAADSSGKLDFFKSSKWTAKTLRQRIRGSSVLYVVPSK